MTTQINAEFQRESASLSASICFYGVVMIYEHIAENY